MTAAWLSAGGKLPFGVKPPQPVLNLAHPLANGLVFDAAYNLGDAGNLELVGLTPISTYTGTTTTVGPHGPARTFAAGADGDTYVATAAVTALSLVTVEFLFKPNGAGGSNTGRILRKGDVGGGLS